MEMKDEGVKEEEFDLIAIMRSDTMRKSILNMMDTLTLRGLREKLMKEYDLREDFFGDEKKRKIVREEVDAIVVPVVKKRMREEEKAAAAAAATRPKSGSAAGSFAMSLRAKQMAAMCREATIPYVHCYKDCRESAVLETKLTAVLAREGLSIKSTMREVKEVKKRRKMEQELDGIDTKNIVAGTARNKPTAATAKPKTQVNGGGTAAAAADHTKPPVSTNSTKTTAAPSTTAPAPSKASSAATTAAAAKPPAGTTAAPKAAAPAVEKKPRPKLVLDDEDDDW